MLPQNNFHLVNFRICGCLQILMLNHHKGFCPVKYTKPFLKKLKKGGGEKKSSNLSYVTGKVVFQ